ncbi:MAG: hypothetical protein GX352_00170 [Clostridiales bacterium]|nr:hypothetical protein [Clostridiales bacterium]
MKHCLPYQWRNDKCLCCGIQKGFKEKFWGSINSKLPFLHLEKEKNRPIVGGIAFFLILIAALSIFALIESPKNASGNGVNDIKIPASASDLEGENYKDVIKRLESAGFSNVEGEMLENLITGWLTKDGEVERVSIDGITSFSEGQSFPKDSEVIVTYHTFP